MNDQASNISPTRRMYHAVAPQAVRDGVNALIRESWFWRNDVRWALRTQAGRTRWVEKTLDLKNSTWVFILGVNNSGTTLLSRLLGTHPRVGDLETEGQRLTHALPRPLKLEVGRLWSQKIDTFRWTEADDPAPAARCKFDWAAKYPPGKKYLLEKSPPNTARSRWLQANFQPCRFLFLTRHPFAVCEGIQRRRNCTIEAAAEHWRLSHVVLFEDLPKLDHVLRVTYERMCDDTLNVLREIETFLEMPQPFDPSVLAREFNVHNMQDQPAMIQNFNAKSVANLTADDIATIVRVAGDVMKRLGYTNSVGQ